MSRIVMAGTAGLLVVLGGFGIAGTPDSVSSRSAVGSPHRRIHGAVSGWLEPSAGPSCDPPWLTPVDAVVIDGFRPPDSPYGPGNRGLEYGTEGGEVVNAVDDGVVAFAGTVGGNGFVVVDHSGGLRSTAAFVDVAVAPGDPVVSGQQIAVAKPGFHLTARRGADYIDPLPLLLGDCLIVRLTHLPS